MDKHAVWKWLILLVLTSFSLVMVIPPREKIRLGLDLKGGTSFVVQIDEEKVAEEIKSKSPDISEADLKAEVAAALEGAQGRALEVIRNRVDNLGIAEPIIYPGKDNRITIQLPGVDEAKRREAEASIQSLAFLQFRMVHEKNFELVEEMFDNRLAPEGHRIVRIGERDYYKRDAAFPETKGDAEYKERLGRFNTPDAGYEFMLEKMEVEKQTVYRPWFVKRRQEMSGEYLKNASVDYRSLGQPVVNLQFDSKGARAFANVTADYAPGGARNPDPNTSRQLAIVLDGTLYSAPNIREAIYGGRAEISGNFSLAEARLLSNILKAGSLPEPVKIVEKRFVAPSLGADSIRSGVQAVIYGGAGVLVFMMVYYLVCGIVADIALILNMVLLPIGMVAAAGFLGIFARDAGTGTAIQLPVLTLPGIAGILLTIGMAVDANVLIFERIREESGTGKRLWTAINAGYDRAFITILDANLTTLLTGVILFVFGSGPIRGFAVTLCAGIVISMFTALVVTKLIFGLFANKMEIGALKMLSVVGKTSVDFVGKRRLCAIASIVVIVAGWSYFLVRANNNPNSVLGVDFTGGVAVTLQCSERVPLEGVRASLKDAGIEESYIQYQKDIDASGVSFLQVKTAGDEINGVKPANVIVDVLQDKYPDAGFVSAFDDEVGPQIGDELKTRAIWSIVLALLGIIIYISWRFELGFAVGAIVALAHDVLITVSIYSLFGRQLSLPIVAALLTIVGYSVNDTIVVFDRIREDLRLMKNKSFKDICNLSINQTLSRTILTSLTTLITVAMLLIFGGGAINDFALALCIGVIVGTYSSIFVATPVVLLWHRDRKPEFATK